ncbi:hypothetical protein [Aliivibrio fischeri]|uniref:hypothetical protein n=1 Tax=Aliivibrio fischeri TaxID=668 RepID=UPI0012D95AE5|nr:hypothetical protein [Aliivibrio fischeri]MUJ20976.1 hypothetical protein [Aliivibrio fischeri]MUL16507.1 hypothetical protein [Aliivibrio fischeri]
MNRLLIYVIFTLFNVSCYAFTLNATVSGNNVALSNGIQQDTNKYTLSDWEPQSNLPPTYEWGPGFNNSGASLVLSGPGGRVEVDVDVVGIEYNTGGASPTSSTPSINALPICESDDFNGNIIHLENSNVGECTTSYHLENKKSVMPFYFLRPIIYLDKQSIADSFQSLDNKKEGYYFGSISLPLRYWYRSIGDIVTYRNINHTFSMKVYYKPSELTEIRIVSPVGGVANLVPTLDTGGESISASTTFQVVAKGLFVEGLVVELDPTNAYKLTMEGADYDIPFSLTCNACDDRLLVDKGAVNFDQSFISKPNSTEIPFSFKVHYDGIGKETIRIGEYSGSFTVMFGADI